MSKGLINGLQAGHTQAMRTQTHARTQTLTHPHTHTHTRSQAKQKQWPCFTPCKTCLGGFINSDLRSPAFPAAFLFTSSFCLSFALLPRLPPSSLTVKGDCSSKKPEQPTMSSRVYSTRDYYDHGMNEVLGIRH